MNMTLRVTSIFITYMVYFTHNGLIRGGGGADWITIQSDTSQTGTQCEKFHLL